MYVVGVSNSFAAGIADHIQKIGAAFYFDDLTLAHGKTLGLGGRRFYFVGRGGALGDVEWQSVASAFGYFNPVIVEQIWTTSLEKIQPIAAARAHVECSQEFGRTRFAEVSGLDDFCAAAETVIAGIDAAGLALYAGISAAPLASDSAARAYQLVTWLREYRGSAHLLAVVCVGLTPKVAHAIKRPNDLELFGWTADDIPPITDEDRARLDEAEEITNRLLASAYDRLDEAGRTALTVGLNGMSAALTTR